MKTIKGIGFISSKNNIMKTVFSIILLLSFISCGSKYDDSLLEGKWKTVEWIKLDNNQLLTNQMDFVFDNNGRYSLDYGSATEKGKFWISGEYLHTIEDERAEKKVRIINLTTDSLVFEMNRAGYLEKVSLLKM